MRLLRTGEKYNRINKLFTAFNRVQNPDNYAEKAVYFSRNYQHDDVQSQQI
ncbi:protein of unknown function [Vibrio tapetis subsp. tapetis]|uniref:Uncharacterized protein n=1 Tax=Vibrio tapetis subsp. tapetis TaxID=1671868 RepID=A0A2N8ZFD8_9VIBR|nr:protein of unknown function [Vibrio tapetis subsp. tapetis]